MRDRGRLLDLRVRPVGVSVAIGLVLMIAGIVLFVAGFAHDTDSRIRWRMNWWAITLIYFGITACLTSKLLEDH